MCSSSQPGYTFANASEREHLDASNTARNDYVDDELKHIEPMYEEIHDRTNAKKNLDFNEDIQPPSYQNSHGEDCSEMNGTKTFPTDGVHRRPVTPSAPYEEELQKTSCKSVPNEYSVFGDSAQQCPQLRSGNCDTIEKNCDNSISSEHANIEELDKDITKDEDLKSELEDKNELTKDNNVLNDTELPSNSSKTIDNSMANVTAESDDIVSNKSVHSYENLNKTGGSSVEDYEPLTYDDREVCFNTSTDVSDDVKTSVKSLREENA
ncbi:uncharacterized protein LOC132721159 [Ruditapes philippinarum]|uniref:uncharacterized protein LOC132721159 n=1 Tax=Ruditapes philippinarum TaxID=129788 RepID=UPI00295A6172|nr:uncharacterized protein LOC132721159 [Ruditapes philippinarum]